MLNKKKYLDNKLTRTDKIGYDKAILFKNIYTENQIKLGKSYLPKGWHWIFFSENYQTNQLAEDGHPIRGSFLPKLEGYKRVFAASEIKFYENFVFNTLVNKSSQIIAINSIKKKNTMLYLIDIKHIYKLKKKLLLEEKQKIAFVRNNYLSNRKRVFNFQNLKLVLSLKYNFNNMILFRYSALTYNSHRIHYDLDYVKKYEGYNSLLVHGPLLANVILDNIKHKLQINLKEFKFRIFKPVFVNEDFSIKFYREKLNNKKIQVFIIKNQSGQVALSASGIYV